MIVMYVKRQSFQVKLFALGLLFTVSPPSGEVALAV